MSGATPHDIACPDLPPAGCPESGPLAPLSEPMGTVPASNPDHTFCAASVRSEHASSHSERQRESDCTLSAQPRVANGLAVEYNWVMWLWLVRGSTVVFGTFVLSVVASRLANRWDLFTRRIRVVLVAAGITTGMITLYGAIVGIPENRDRRVDVRALSLAATSYVDGIRGSDRPIFDRFVDVPSIGDERTFVHVKGDGVDGGFSRNLQVQPGQVVLARLYLHNNADSSLNGSGDGPGVARDVVVWLTPVAVVGNSQSIELEGVIRSRNAIPTGISDRAVLYSTRPFELRPLEGTVEESSNSGTRTLPDSVTSGDRGYSLGNIPGCFANVRLITAKFVVVPK